MVRKIFAALTFLAIAVSGVATAQEAATDRLPLEGIAAVVNDKPISYSDVRQRARMLLLSLGSRPRNRSSRSPARHWNS